MRKLALFGVFATLAAAQTLSFSGAHSQTIKLTAGQTVEVYAGLPAPSELPPNGRIAVEWGKYRKILHALDPDFYIVYRAPKAGDYTLKLTKIENEEASFNKPRWRETGTVEKLNAYPRLTPWPAGLRVKLKTWIKPVIAGRSLRGMLLEAEPNDSIAEAQPVPMGATGADETLHIAGGADDIEYFDNGDIGTAGLETRAVDMHVARLRAKLKDPDGEDDQPDAIVTVRAHGYMAGPALTVRENEP